MDRYAWWAWTLGFGSIMVGLAAFNLRSSDPVPRATGAFFAVLATMSLGIHVNLLVGLAVNP